MSEQVTQYFERTVLPGIDAAFPHLTSQISIQVEGSCGLGIADEHSDLEANVYLEDPIWRSEGARLQLLLEDMKKACPFRDSIISASPVSGLLGNRAKALLSGDSDLPWEELDHEDLFSLHETLVVHDGLEIFQKLRVATLPGKIPDWIWKKRLLIQMKRLVWENLPELESCVKRSRNPEAHILFGLAVHDILQIGFTLSRRYHPWRTHLRWAYAKLPDLSDSVLPLLDSATSALEWPARLDAIRSVRSIYIDTVAERNLLPEIDIHRRDLGEELLWAERLEAWKNPNWRDWITRCKEKARKAGHEEKWYIWSLWHWE
jgi:hypothetical protein